VIPRSQPRERIAIRDISTEAVDLHEPMARTYESAKSGAFALIGCGFLEPGKVCEELFISVRRRPCMTLVPAALDHRVDLAPCRMQAREQEKRGVKAPPKLSEHHPHRFLSTTRLAF
jgi:hypothetical protein